MATCLILGRLRRGLVETSQQLRQLRFRRLPACQLHKDDSQVVCDARLVQVQPFTVRRIKKDLGCIDDGPPVLFIAFRALPINADRNAPLLPTNGFNALLVAVANARA